MNFNHLVLKSTDDVKHNDAIVLLSLSFNSACM